MRESHTAVVERNMIWRGAFASEPCECAWAGEAIFFCALSLRRRVGRVRLGSGNSADFAGRDALV